MASTAPVPGKQAINFDTSIGKKVPFWTVMLRSIQIAATVDVLFFFLFHAFGSPLLAWINVGSVLLYLLAYGCVKRRHNKSAVVLIWIEAVGHATIGTLMVGWDAGFHYYLLIFVPAIFVSTSIQRAVNAVFVLWLLYVGADLAMRSHMPIEPLHPTALLLLRYFNISVVFSMLAYLSYFYVRIVSDAEKRLRMLAMTDPLTGLFNRRHVFDIAHHEARRRVRSRAPLSFLLADVDHFNEINDVHGHEQGDKILMAVAAAMRRAVRNHDIVARWGGEEFLIVLPDTGLEGAVQVAERIRTEVEAIHLQPEHRNVHVTLTLGASLHDEQETVSDAIARADNLLYRGKEAGRNRVMA